MREWDFDTDQGSIHFRCAVEAPAVVLPARSAPNRALESGLPTTAEPASVLRSPLVHKPCMGG